MDEAEGKKRIAFWEIKKVAYKRKNNKSGIKKAEAAIERITAVMSTKKKSDNKNEGSVVTSESKKSYILKEPLKEDKGGLI
ncbi:MAG: hypothetical protein IMF19_12055 [Proteobacteria bacterium]|nr:hypothetical protein [Pseudomonadota bacterium]